MSVDTTTEAVERLAQTLELSAPIWVHGASPRQPKMTITGKASATLRVLAQERDAAVKARDEVIMRMVAMARQAGSWQGIAEGKDIVIRQIEAERDAARVEVERIRAAWLFVIQAENSCAASGAPCRSGNKCGCAAELEMLLREHDERAALAATEDKQ